MTYPSSKLKSGMLSSLFLVFIPVFLLVALLYNIEQEENTLIKGLLSHSNEEEEIIEKQVGEILHDTPPCQQKYLLITTQRSGSTWTCNVFDKQDNITCGGSVKHQRNVTWYEGMKFSEMLMSHPKWDSWEEAQKFIDDAFDEVCENAPSIAIGFKVMYDQIPEQFVRDGQFEQYLRENNIAVIHLVREAKILKIASLHDKEYLKASGIKAGPTGNNDHATNQRKVDDSVIIPKMPWKVKVKEMLRLEEESNNWQKSIHFMTSVRSFYLSYEHLLSEDSMEDNIAQVVSFLLMPSSVLFHEGLRPVNKNSDLLQLHSPRCSDRIENYAEFIANARVKNSRSAAACIMLEKLYDSMQD